MKLEHLGCEFVSTDRPSHISISAAFCVRSASTSVEAERALKTHALIGTAGTVGRWRSTEVHTALTLSWSQREHLLISARLLSFSPQVE